MYSSEIGDGFTLFYDLYTDIRGVKGYRSIGFVGLSFGDIARARVKRIIDANARRKSCFESLCTYSPP